MLRRALLCALALVLASSAPAAEIDWKAWATETRGLIVEAMKVDTINPPGNEEVLCKKLASLLEKDGIPTKVLVSAPGRGNLFATLKGTGTGKPMLFMAHLDVVGVKGQDWTVPPLEPSEKDGYLYGRGALDDKSMAVLGVQVMRLLKKTGASLERDFVLALTADEESSAKYGLWWILNEHPDAVVADFALNEGGQIIREGGKVKFIEIQTAEKMYMDLTLEATGPSGHSSVPGPENAIVKLAQALVRLSTKRAPIMVTETTRHMLEGLIRAGAPESALLKKVLAGGAAGNEAAEQLSRKAHFNAILRTTFVSTMVEGGTRVNVLPARATANVNCRVIPGTDMKAFIKQIETWIADPGVKVVYDPADLTSAPASPVDHPLFAAVKKVAAEQFPGAIVMPVMSPGATDSRFLRMKGIPCYGLLPFPMTRDDDRRMHAADERLPLDSIEPGLKFAHGLVWELCR